MSDPTYPAYPILAIISCVVVLIPFPWHFRAGNTGTCMIMAWTSLGCLNLGINTIVWHDNAIDWAPVWCDISSRIILAIGIGIPASCLCITRRLYIIASCRAASTTLAEKRRDALLDLSLGIGLPLIQLPLQYIVNGHRYDILEDIGCYPFTYNTWPAFPLSYVWPNVLSAVSLIYSILSLKHFMIRRAQFSQFLAGSSGMNANRYLRLMALSSFEIFLSTPINAYGLYLNSYDIHPWISWANTHYDWITPDIFPSVIWKAKKDNVIIVEINRWALILAVIVFFAFFGFADEAKKNYKAAYMRVKGFFGVKSESIATGSKLKQFALMKNQNTASTLPAFISRTTFPPPPPAYSASDPPQPSATSSFASSPSSAKFHPYFDRPSSLEANFPKTPILSISSTPPAPIPSALAQSRASIPASPSLPCYEFQQLTMQPQFDIPPSATDSRNSTASAHTFGHIVPPSPSFSASSYNDNISNRSQSVSLESMPSTPALSTLTLDAFIDRYGENHDQHFRVSHIIDGSMLSRSSIASHHP